MSHSHHAPLGRRRSTSRASAITALLVTMAALILAPSALAGKPKGEFSVFADCPLATKGVSQCVYSQFTGGKVVIGPESIPINKTITLQGGLIVTEKEETFVNVTEGTTLSKTAEEVPGGFEGHAVISTLELVGAVTLSRTNLAAGKGVALKLPVRVHLTNPVFGEGCFIGSSTSPITLNLTTGSTSPPAPNKSITGTPGTLESRDSGNLILYKGNSLVENAFSVPTAHGCGAPTAEAILDPIINTMFGLPSAGGYNTAILSGTSQFASAEAVRASE